METKSMNNFAEMSVHEMQNIYGGGLTIAIAGCLIAVFSAGFAGGIAVGLNRKNRESK